MPAIENDMLCGGVKLIYILVVHESYQLAVYFIAIVWLDGRRNRDESDHIVLRVGEDICEK